MVGKTSLFTILTGVHEATRVGLMEARVGVTKVPDPRLEALAELFEPPKVTYATVEYLDFPAISKEALRNPSYLASLRNVDALAHVLRVFEDESVPHEHGSVDPAPRCSETSKPNWYSATSWLSRSVSNGWRKIARRSSNPELDREFDLLNAARRCSRTPSRSETWS